ncbi:hypothetical protein SGFS_021990 [Streptomyces graminofaciens]|uniref:Uncharacterized protein n=1 Tax=Streptomyces graminofaciens TaxID=68212 RepID=A0ABM7F4V4_9ACTN|nr:hypothetical protein SGFS_021990 [Streptomyces graminofaciens]
MLQSPFGRIRLRMRGHAQLRVQPSPRGGSRNIAAGLREMSRQNQIDQGDPCQCCSGVAFIRETDMPLSPLYARMGKSLIGSLAERMFCMRFSQV